MIQENIKIKNFENYVGKMFSDEGFNLLLQFTKNLIKLYYKKKDEEYPFNIGIVYGIPYNSENGNERIFKNKDELLGRIKGYMMILSLNKIEVDFGANKILFEI